MAALGKLVVSLSANIAEFVGAMDKAAFLSEKRMKQIEKSVTVAAAAVGAAASAAAAGLAVLVKQQIDAADEAAKAAQKMGTTVEVLTAMQHAAGLSGASNEQLQAGFLKLSKSIADGNEAFAAMGVQLRDSNGEMLATDKILLAVADKFKGYRDGVEKTALAQEIFGRSGAELLPFLNSGAAGINAMMEESKELGLVLDTQTSKSAEAFNDNLSRMQSVQTGLVRQLTTAMLPTMTALSEEMVRVAKSTDLVGPIAKGLTVLFQTVTVVGANVAFVLRGIGTELGGIAAQAAAIARFDFRGAGFIGDAMKEDAAKARAELDAFEQRIMNLSGSQAIQRAAQEAQQTGGVAAPIVAAAKKAKEAQKELEDVWSIAEAGAARFEAMLDEGRRVYDETRTPVEQLASRLSRLQELLDAGMFGQRQSAEAWDIYTRAVMKAQDEFDNLTKAVEEDTDIMKTYAEQAARGIQDAFAEFLFDPFKGGVNGMLENFTVMLRKMAAQQLAAGLLKGLGNWGSTGGGQGTFIGGIVSGLFGGGRANGGPVEAGRSYLVGEFGPELIHIGAQGGTVTPTEKLMGKAVTVINNFTFDRPVDRRTQEQVAAMAGGAIQTAMRRNG